MNKNRSPPELIGEHLYYTWPWIYSSEVSGAMPHGHPLEVYTLYSGSDISPIRSRSACRYTVQVTHCIPIPLKQYQRLTHALKVCDMGYSEMYDPLGRE